MAAFNHDVLEDCPEITVVDLATVIGPRACAMVVDVTKHQVPNEQKAARDRAYLDQLPGLPWESRLLKLADRIDNLRSVPASGDPAKARRYLEVSLAEFIPLAAATSPVAERLILEACDQIGAYLTWLAHDDEPAL
jgi:(p)ppGpp synthase/HD superfamily hydrolase